MKNKVLATNMRVRCGDGTLHDDVKMFVRDRQRIFLDCHDCEIQNVQEIEQATVVVPVMVFSAVMQVCKECQS